MKRNLIVCMLLLSAWAWGSDTDRFLKYLADHGQSNAVYGVDFTLQNDADDRGTYVKTWAYTNIAIPTIAECPSEAEAAAWVKEQWQLTKPVMLKLVENVYVSFLTNDWTTVLRTYNLIPSNYVVTVTNKSEADNVTYLLYLKVLSKPDYYNMAGEFDRYKSTIVGYGGIMSEVIWHSEVAQ